MTQQTFSPDSAKDLARKIYQRLVRRAKTTCPCDPWEVLADEFGVSGFEIDAAVKASDGWLEWRRYGFIGFVAKPERSSRRRSKG